MRKLPVIPARSLPRAKQANDLLRVNPHERFERRQLGRTDARHGQEAVDRAEPSAPCAVVDDGFRRSRAYARQCVELFRRGGVEIDRPARRRARRPACAWQGRWRLAPLRHVDAVGVSDLGRQVDHVEIGVERRSPGGGDGVDHPPGPAEADDTGSDHRTGNVDNDLTGRRGRGRRRRLRPRQLDGGRRRRTVEENEAQDGDDDEGHDDRRAGPRRPLDDVDRRLRAVAPRRRRRRA